MSQSIDKRKSLNEEFFTMCLLSLKMKNIKHPYVMQLKPQDLFDKAQQENITKFPQFWTWLENYIEKLKYQHTYAKRKEVKTLK